MMRQGLDHARSATHSACPVPSQLAQIVAIPFGSRLARRGSESTDPLPSGSTASRSNHLTVGQISWSATEATEMAPVTNSPVSKNLVQLTWTFQSRSVSMIPSRLNRPMPRPRMADHECGCKAAGVIGENRFAAVVDLPQCGHRNMR